MAVTIKDIAGKAGVSIATVSKVLNGRDSAISEATRSKILSLAAELGYRPNMVAKGLRAKTTRTIGFVLPDISNPFFPAIARGIEDAAQKAGFTVIFCDTDDDARREREAIDSLMAKMVDGLILTRALDTSLTNVAECRVPTVVVDRCSGVDLAGVGTVYTNMARATYEATRLLVERGCARIGFIAVPRTLAPDRHRGYAAALAEAGRDLDPGLVFEGGYDAKTGFEGVRVLVGEHITSASVDGIACGNDLIAMGALQALRQRGIAVPDEVRVVGLDDIYLSRYLEPALTTVRQPAYEMGQAAAQMLIDALVEGAPLHSKELPFQMVERYSA